LGVTEEDSSYLMQIDTVQKDMYDINDDRISILSKDGSLKDITEASEILNVELLSKKIRKYYFCYHRI
ncbi:MAG: phosphohydrolase, partial [Prevotella pallens]|nr:phosphohydrolase [Prevotella pallens]